jgi:hypothetical protein
MDKTEWLSSKEAQKKLKIKSCDLMHLREAGKLKFKKVGNAYFYFFPDSLIKPALKLIPPTCLSIGI